MSDHGLNAFEKVAQTQERNLLAAWRAMLEHEAGRLVLHSILDKAGIAKVGPDMFAFFDSSSDALLRGRQQMGAEILEVFVHSNAPEAYYVMLKEADIRSEMLSTAYITAETEEDED